MEFYKKEENIEKIIKNLKSVEEKLEEICNLLEENGEVTINLFKKETMSLFPFQKSLDEVVEDIRLYRKSITEEKKKEFKVNQLAKVIGHPKHYDKNSVGHYFRIEKIIETEYKDGYHYPEKLTLIYGKVIDGWGISYFLDPKYLEPVDETNKWTVSLYHGMGGILTPFEVTAEHELEALEEVIKKIYNQKGFNNNFFISTEEAMAKEEDEFYKKDFKKWKKEREDKDAYFDEFLEEMYDYKYLDVPEVGPVFIGNISYARIEKGLGLYGNSIRENEE